MDCLHDEVTERFAGSPQMRAYDESGSPKDQKLYEPMYREVKADFMRVGCEAIGGYCTSTRRDPTMSAIYEIMGDDLDGAASMIEDAEAVGLL